MPTLAEAIELELAASDDEVGVQRVVVSADGVSSDGVSSTTEHFEVYDNDDEDDENGSDATRGQS